MAQAPPKKLSPGYAKRIARALAQGKTRQQARGHKAREHVERRRRELDIEGLTTHQKTKIREFMSHQSAKYGLYISPHDFKTTDWNDYYNIFRMNGYDLLNKMKKFVKTNYTKSKETNKKIYANKQALLEAFGGIKGVESWMLFYGSL